jgi:hypothetical protein
MAGAGTRVLGRRRALLRAAGVGAALAVIGSLMAWNASQYVAPSIELSRARGRVVMGVADRVRPNARLVTSLLLAGRLADLGFDAGGGFEALTGEIRAGNPKPGVSALIAQARRRPLYVSSAAFGLVPNQARFLGITGNEIWRRLHECCELTPILHTPGLPNDETLYRVRPR